MQDELITLGYMKPRPDAALAEKSAAKAARARRRAGQEQRQALPPLHVARRPPGKRPSPVLSFMLTTHGAGLPCVAPSMEAAVPWADHVCFTRLAQANLMYAALCCQVLVGRNHNENDRLSHEGGGQRRSVVPRPRLRRLAHRAAHPVRKVLAPVSGSLHSLLRSQVMR